MPTLNLLVYFLILAFAYGFRSIYLGWFGPYLVAVVAAVPLVLLLLSLPSVYRLRLNLHVPSHVSKGKACGFRIQFTNPALLPIRQVRIWVEIKNLFTGEVCQEKHLFLSVGTSSASLPLPTHSCGKLVIRVTRFECRDLLGLFSFQRPPCAAVQCAILPRPQRPSAPLNLEALLNTLPNLQPKYGGGFSEEHDLRPYHPGDPTNAIHWKLSSKMDEPIVREALERKDKDIFLVLTHFAKNDSSLEHVYWFSLALCEKELPHFIVSDAVYPVENEDESLTALSSILSSPAQPPTAYDGKNARCVILFDGEEVRVP